MSWSLLRYICIFIRFLKACRRAFKPWKEGMQHLWECGKGGQWMAQPAPGHPGRNTCNTSGIDSKVALSPWHHPAAIPAGHSDSRDRDCCCSVPGFKFADDFKLTAGWALSMQLGHGCPCPQNEASLGFINQSTQVPTSAEAKSF